MSEGEIGSSLANSDLRWKLSPSSPSLYVRIFPILASALFERKMLLSSLRLGDFG